MAKALPALGNDDYRVREEAVQQLLKLGIGGATCVLRLGREGSRSGLTAEQNRELDAVISHCCVIPWQEAAALHDDPDFLLDCLDCPEPTARRVALKAPAKT